MVGDARRGWDQQQERRPSWQLGRFLIVRRVDLRPGETPLGEPPESYLDQWLQNPQTLRVLAEMVRPTAPGGTEDAFFVPGYSERVRDGVLDAFHRRELALLWEGPRDPIGPGRRQPGREIKPPRPEAPPATPKSTKTWVEFRLVNEKREPIAGSRYRLKLTDGSIREGTLDQNGSVRVPGIEPGVCEITLLDYDAKEWTRVQ